MIYILLIDCAENILKFCFIIYLIPYKAYFEMMMMHCYAALKMGVVNM